MLRKRSRESGLTLIELLVVVAIIGVLSAAAIWNYLIAIDRGRQKKTMSDMRSIAQAWEARATDKGSYNAAAASGIPDWPAEAVTFDQMATMLSPTYIRPLAKVDGWNRPFAFALDQPVGIETRADIYAIRSSGKDGIFQDSYTEQEFPGRSFECDIVYMNGTFVVRPKVN